MFYGPLHYLLIREIVRAIPGAADGAPSLVDLGCGTGAAGDAWAVACRTRPQVIGVDRHPCTLTDAAHTYREFDLRAKTMRGACGDGCVSEVALALILAAFTVNELPDDARDALLPRLLACASAGDRILIVEPLGERRGADGGALWQLAFVAAGGRADEWRVFRWSCRRLSPKLDQSRGLESSRAQGPIALSIIAALMAL